jgi:hypothetical protein
LEVNFARARITRQPAIKVNYHSVIANPNIGDAETGCIERLKLKRAQMLPWFANRTSTAVVMEECGGAHEWGRALCKLGTMFDCCQRARCAPSFSVTRPTLPTRKRYGQQAGSLVRFVPVKTEAKQIVLSMHQLHCCARNS